MNNNSIKTDRNLKDMDLNLHSSIPKKNIVFVGIMGVGKTVIGKKLSNVLKIPFKDSDFEIEKKFNASISSIFESSGEFTFREAEADIILEIIKKPPVILSTGGGAFCNPKIRSKILKTSISIWLDAKPENILGRIKNFSTRPLLSGDNPLNRLKKLSNERKNIYKKATTCIKTDHLGIEEITNNILIFLNKIKYIKSNTCLE